MNNRVVFWLADVIYRDPAPQHSTILTDFWELYVDLEHSHVMPRWDYVQTPEHEFFTCEVPMKSGYGNGVAMAVLVRFSRDVDAVEYRLRFDDEPFVHPSQVD